MVETKVLQLVEPKAGKLESWKAVKWAGSLDEMSAVPMADD